METKKPVTKDTIYRLYSDTKPITGVAALILCEEGLLSLNDPVSKYIPAFKNPVVATTTRVRPGPPEISNTLPARREVTIRDCLAIPRGWRLIGVRRTGLSTKFKKFIEESGWGYHRKHRCCSP